MTLMTFEQHDRAIGILTAGMSARDIDRHFQRHELTLSRLLNRLQQTGNVADRPRSGRPCKTTPQEDRFLTTSTRHNRFLSSRKLGRLLRNATGTRVWERTVRNRLHAARLKVTSLCWYSADVTKLWSLVLHRICQLHDVGTFQHDNARPHTSRHTQNILRIFNVNVLQWPARSPDLSPIKHLWDHYGRQVIECHDIDNILNLELALQAEWVRIPLQVKRKLICSMRCRCLAVMAANGGHTRYSAVSQISHLVP